MAEERLQKILARAGISSRRSAEDLIENGRVTVNGTKATLGMSADAARDDIRLDGERIRMPTSFDYFLLNKPKGVISDEDVAHEHESARDLIPVEGHLYPVGRLDLGSEGLMLFTNDGALAHRLTHPRYDHPKTYQVIVEGNATEDALDQWRRGVVIEGKRTRPAEVKKVLKNRQGTVLEVTLREGRKRQIRRVAARLGFPVVSLIRTSLGPLTLGDLPVGAWRRLTPQEVDALQSIREQSEPRKPRREAGAAKPRTGAGQGRPGPRRPMPKGQGPSRGAARGDGPARRKRSDSAEGGERPARRGWPDTERRGVSRTEASDQRSGQGDSRSRRPRTQDSDSERHARPSRGGTSSGPRGESRPTGGGQSDTRSRGSRSQQADQGDSPSRPSGGRPAPGSRGGSRPARGGEGDSRSDKPRSRPGGGTTGQRPARGKPAANRLGGARPSGKPGQTRRPNKPNQPK